MILLGEVLKAFLCKACFQVQNASVPHIPEEELDETLGASVGDSTESHSESQNDPRCSRQHNQAGPINQFSTSSDKGHDTDTDPAISIHVKKAKQCPHQDCREKPTYSKVTHLQRHYKMRKAIRLTVHSAFSN
jgi:hypothetical protein